MRTIVGGGRVSHFARKLDSKVGDLAIMSCRKQREKMEREVAAGRLSMRRLRRTRKMMLRRTKKNVRTKKLM